MNAAGDGGFAIGEERSEEQVQVQSWDVLSSRRACRERSTIRSTIRWEERREEIARSERVGRTFRVVERRFYIPIRRKYVIRSINDVQGESVMDGGKSGRNLLLLPVKRIRPRAMYRGYALNS